MSHGTKQRMTCGAVTLMGILEPEVIPSRLPAAYLTGQAS
jgi:hypothetical protein